MQKNTDLPRRGFRPGQICKLPPSPQICKTQVLSNAAGVSLPKLVTAILFLKKGEPITQEQCDLDLLLTPSLAPKAQFFNSCSYSQAKPSARPPFQLPAETEEAFSCSRRNKAVASIRSLYLHKENSPYSKGGRCVKLSSAPSAESNLSPSTSALNSPPQIPSFVSQISERIHRETETTHKDILCLLSCAINEQ